MEAQPAPWSSADAIAQIRLTRLMEVTHGHPEIHVGLIDGIVDRTHPALAGAALRTLDTGHTCAPTPSGSGQHHGTSMAGILFGDRTTGVPGLCPASSFDLYPIFCDREDGLSAGVSATDLAEAIVATVDAGARLVNLSLGVVASSVVAYRELDEACDHARRRGVLLVCACGNQGRMGYVPLVSHSWVIPVVATDRQGRVLPAANLSPSIGARGVCAPGDDIFTTVPGGRYGRIAGTSAATAFVTGALALLWSLRPDLSAIELKSRIEASVPRASRGLVPPLLDAVAASRLVQPLSRSKEMSMYAEAIQARNDAVPTMRSAVGMAHLVGPQTPDRAIVAAQAGSCPTCAVGAGGDGGPATHVYAIGTLKMRFPSPGVEKEFAQAAAGMGTANLTDQEVVHQTLRQHRYLANEVCWVYSIENTDTYLLVPRDAATLDKFIEATAPASRGIDVDVVIGQRGPMAPAEFCNGLVVPIVLVDQIYSFNKPELISAIPKPTGTKGSATAFEGTAEELFDRIQQLADNVGATDEHRALNYLSVRYPQIYANAASMHAEQSHLTSVEVIPSRLSGSRKLVDVVMAYTHRPTDVVTKFYVRVDVTEKYPFIDRKLSPFYDR